MILTQDYIKYRLTDPSVDSFDLFLYFCMRNFISTAKVVLDTGELKPVKDGFLLYVSERLDRLGLEFFIDDLDDDDIDADEDVIGGVRERELALVREIEDDLMEQIYDYDDRER